MYKGPESYNTPPNPNVWGSAGERDRDNFAKDAYSTPFNSDAQKLVGNDADAEARINNLKTRQAAAEAEQARLANLLSGDFEIAQQPHVLGSQPRVAEDNLAHVVNPGPKTLRPETIPTPNVNKREVSVDGETKTKPAKTLWQRLFFG